MVMKELSEVYPRVPDYVVRLEPIRTTNKAVFQYLATEEELARFPSQTPRSVACQFGFVVQRDAKTRSSSSVSVTFFLGSSQPPLVS